MACALSPPPQKGALPDVPSVIFLLVIGSGGIFNLINRNTYFGISVTRQSRLVICNY